MTKSQRVAVGIAAVLLGTSPAFAQQRVDAPVQPGTTESRPGLLIEPRGITKAIDLFNRRTSKGETEPKDGFYVELGNMVTGAGWLSAGPGYRRHVFNRQAIFSASGAVSVRLYRRAQARIEFPHLANDRLTVGAQTLFSDALQVNYYGLGNDSNESSRSGYRLRTSDLTTYARVGTPALSARARIGWLLPVFVGPMGRSAIYPDTLDAFTESGAPGLSGSPSFLHTDLSLTADSRDYPGHPTRGGFYQAVWSMYADQQTGEHSFQRYEAGASHYVPLGSDKWILALSAGAVLSRVPDGNSVPIYLMPNLGGRNQRGFADYRFHDLNVQSYSVESRWRLFSHVDVAGFVDLGSVSPTIRQLALSDLKPAYGAGIRLHNQKVTIGRLDLAHGTEGWRIVFKMNDPFRRSTQSNGWRPVAPFFP